MLLKTEQLKRCNSQKLYIEIDKKNNIGVYTAVGLEGKLLYSFYNVYWTMDLLAIAIENKEKGYFACSADIFKCFLFYCLWN